MILLALTKLVTRPFPYLPPLCSYVLVSHTGRDLLKGTKKCENIEYTELGFGAIIEGVYSSLLKQMIGHTIEQYFT